MRVNTGISPAGQAEYTGIDEAPIGGGAGVSIQQFNAVHSLTGTSVTIKEREVFGGGNNYAVVIAPIPVPITTSWHAATGAKRFCCRFSLTTTTVGFFSPPCQRLAR